jgi:hypothetical protein
VFVWALAAVGAYYWYSHYGPGASKAQAASQGASTINVTGATEDEDTTVIRQAGHPPAPKTTGDGGWKTITVKKDWNGWSLDKIARYLHWTPETKADVLEANARGGKEIRGSTVFHTGDSLIRPVGSDKATAPSDMSMTAHASPAAAAYGVTTKTGAPAAAGAAVTYAPYGGSSQWKTATGWEAAAINYLIGEGIAPDQASTAVWAYLHSQPLSSRMQADVNLATDGIGPPPAQPGPAITVKNARPTRNTPRPKATTKAKATVAAAA